MAKAPTRCTLCTGITALTSITHPDTKETRTICTSCQLLVTLNANNQKATEWDSYTMLLERLDKHFGRGLRTDTSS